MKRSRGVPLLMLGAATVLAGCDGASSLPEPEAQNYYETVEDCRSDWGDGDWCKKPPASGGSSSIGTGSSSGVYGPRYYWDHSSGRPMVVEGGVARAVRSGAASYGAPSHARGVSALSVSHGTSAHSISRGGFGSTAHGFSGGG
jgi:hypothetical protein